MNNNWFKATWEGSLNPLYTLALFPYLERKYYQKTRKICIFIFTGSDFWLAYDFEDLNNLGQYLIEKKIKNSRNLDNLIKKFNIAVNNLEKIFKVINKENLKDINNRKLWLLYQELMKKYLEIFGIVGCIEPLTIFLQNEISKKVYNDKYKYILFAPSTKSFLQDNYYKLLQIARKQIHDYDNKKTNDIVHTLSQKTLDLAQKHANDYFWIKNNYFRSLFLDREYFLKEIADILASKNTADINREIKNIKKSIINFSKKEKVIKKLNLPKKYLFFVQITTNLIKLQDERKAMALRTTFFLDQLNSEISRRFNISFLKIAWLLPEEIKNLILRGIKPNYVKIKQRSKKCGIIWNGKKLTVSTNNRILAAWEKRLLAVDKKNLSEIKGTSACVGKVNGRVKVVLSFKDVAKLKTGEILVATNTTPEYISVMKKAKAIITEKGGITSHAAIVSRELHVPCIVGASNITQILKDGDLVEVDADKGVVRILKKSK